MLLRCSLLILLVFWLDNLKAQLYPYKSDGLWGYFNDSIEYVTEPIYLSAEKFEHQYGLVQNKDGYFLIDTLFKRKSLIYDSLVYKHPYYFGLKKGDWSVINRKLEVIQKGFLSIPIYSNAHLTGFKKGGWCISDSLGNQILNKLYDSGYQSDSLIMISHNNQVGVFHIDGTNYVPIKFESITHPQDSIFVFKQKGMWGIYKLNQGIILNAEWNIIRKNDNEYYQAVKNGITYLFSVQKERIINPEDPYLSYSAQDTSILIWSGKGIGVMDFNGNVLIPAKYNDIQHLDRNYFLVSSGRRKGLFSLKYGEIVPPRFHSLSSIGPKYFIGQLGKKSAVYRNDGKLIIPLNKHLISYRTSDDFVIQNDTLLGLVNAEGDTILPIKFNYISDFKNRVMKIRQDSSWYIALENGIISKRSFDRIYAYSKLIKAYKSDTLFMFYIDDMNLNNFDIYPNIHSFQVGTPWLSYDYPTPIPVDTVLKRGPKEESLNGETEWFFDGYSGKYGRRFVESQATILIPEYDGYEKRVYYCQVVYVDIPKAEATINGHVFEYNRLYGLVNINKDRLLSACTFLQLTFNNNLNCWVGISTDGKRTLISKLGTTLTRDFNYVIDASEDQVIYAEKGGLQWTTNAGKSIRKSLPLTLSSANHKLIGLDSRSYQVQNGTWGLFNKVNGAKVLTHCDTISPIIKRHLIYRKGKIVYAKKGTQTTHRNRYIRFNIFDGTPNPFYSFSTYHPIYGLYNQLGENIIPNNFDGISLPQENRIAVLQEGLYAFFDTQGEQITPFQFSQVGSFTNGLAWVQTKKGTGLINKKGEFVLQPNYKQLGNYSEGLIAFRNQDKWGFMNIDAQVLISERFDRAEGFKRGIANVKVSTGWGCINTEGSWVNLPIYYKIERALDGKIVILYRGNKVYINDTLGNLLAQGSKDQFNSNQYYISLQKRNKLITINKQLDIREQKDVEHVLFNDSPLIAIRKNKQWFFINADGEMTPTYESFTPSVWNNYSMAGKDSTGFVYGSFSEVKSSSDPAIACYDQYMIFQQPDSLKIVDIQSQKQASYKAHHIAYFPNGKFIINRRYSSQLIDFRTNKILHEQSSCISNDGNYLVFSRNENFNLFSNKGNGILDFRYSNIIPYKSNLIRVESDNYIGYVDSKGKVLIELSK